MIIIFFTLFFCQLFHLSLEITNTAYSPLDKLFAFSKQGSDFVFIYKIKIHNICLLNIHTNFSLSILALFWDLKKKKGQPIVNLKMYLQSR